MVCVCVVCVCVCGVCVVCVCVVCVCVCACACGVCVCVCGVCVCVVCVCVKPRFLSQSYFCVFYYITQMPRNFLPNLFKKTIIDSADKSIIEQRN